MSRVKAALVLAAALLCGCDRDMQHQPRAKPLDPSPVFTDGRSARPLLADTVARGRLRGGGLLETGREGKEFSRDYPFPITAQVLERGHQRFDIYCSVCHGRTGEADGMVVRRGFPKPPSFVRGALRDAPPGLFFAAASDGFGVMYPYADRVSVRDRWAIAAYIKTLQLAAQAPVSELSADERRRLGARP
jgi:cytochrome c553